jgi:D-alanyl-D-alanine carboxypeptidase
LIHDFPEYNSYWHIPAIKYGRRIVRNYNTLLGRYPGADGMKTGFICAAGFNLVATATRNGKQLIAVVLGASSGGARAVKAAELLESGFTQNPLGWLTPSLGTVDALTPISADPPNLHDQICSGSGHRKRAPAEDEDMDAGGENTAGENTPFSALLSSLRAPTPKGAALLNDFGAITPVVVYTGPTRTADQLAKMTAIEEAEPHHRRKGKGAATAAKEEKAGDTDAKPAAKPEPKPAAEKPKKSHRAAATEPAPKPAPAAQ